MNNQTTTANQPVPEADPSLKPVIVTDKDRFQFDAQGFMILRGAMSPKDISEMHEALQELEKHQYDDSHWRKPQSDTPQVNPTREETPGLLRLNGLFRLSNAFDRVIDYPTVFPYLQAFMNCPQIVNTWSISKFSGGNVGNWHRGLEPHHYAVRHGLIRTRMLNTVYFLTDNNIDDGCMLAIPGAHKSNFDLKWSDYKGMDLPGAIPITGKAGDVLIFSESLLHTGLGNSTGRRRTNLYFNYISLDYNNAKFPPMYPYHGIMPPHIRSRFTQTRKEASAWMENLKTID